MSIEQYIKILELVVWPIIVLLIILLFFKKILKLFNVLLHRIEKGAEFSTPWASVGPLPSTVKEPEENEPITENNMALIHSSWRCTNKDRGYQHVMYCFHAIIQAPDKVLNQIEYVKYKLHSSYPNNEQVVHDRKSHFKLKELAWGESNLRADIKIKGQDKPIRLSRYINLNESGPRIP